MGVARAEVTTEQSRRNAQLEIEICGSSNNGFCRIWSHRSFCLNSRFYTMIIPFAVFCACRHKANLLNFVRRIWWNHENINKYYVRHTPLNSSAFRNVLDIWLVIRVLSSGTQQSIWKPITHIVKHAQAHTICETISRQIKTNIKFIRIL